MPSWFSNTLKRNEQQQQLPPPPSLKARKLKEQAWKEAIQQQSSSPIHTGTTPSHSNLAIKYHHPQQRFNKPASPPWLQQQQQQQQQQSLHPQPEEIEVLTQSLAIRLEELATANHDGLLDDDEYRTLRKGLFDQINASNQQPVLSERSANLALSSPQGSDSIRSSEANSQRKSSTDLCKKKKKSHGTDLF
jgi:hypothetical protein